MVVFEKDAPVQFDAEKFADCLVDPTFAVVVLLSRKLRGPVWQRAMKALPLEDACAKMKEIADRVFDGLKAGELVLDAQFICDLSVNPPTMPDNSVAFRVMLKLEPTPDLYTLPDLLVMSFEGEKEFRISWWGDIKCGS